MVALLDLWLPILLSALGVFIVSSIVHMVLPYHKSDHQKVSGEDGMRESLKLTKAQPGQYMFPHASSMQEHNSPEHQLKMKDGPIGMLIIFPESALNMGRQFAIWFLFSIVVGIFCAYLARLSLAPGAEFIEVLQRVGATAFLAYGLSNVTDSIWKGVPWSITVKFLFDGLLYGLATGAIFALLWPASTL